MSNPLVAIQVGSVSFIDEGVEQALDIFQEKGEINALFLANFTYTRGTGGRQIPGHPLPDHGAQEYDHDWIGGNYAKANPQYYGRTFIKPDGFVAPEHPDFAFMEEVIPKARERDMKIYCWMEESSYGPQPRRIPNFVHTLEVDAWGRKHSRPCFNNPDYRNWHLGLVEDYVQSYDVDGIAWCSERNGPLQTALMNWMGGTSLTCFCEHCRTQAREAGINVDNARKGMQELDTLSRQGRPVDGWFVTFWRLLLRYPEILAWERLWHEGQNQLFRDMYGMVKALNKNVQFGWHIMHLNSFSPFYRATQDIQEFSRYADFIKLVVYDNCAGPRFVQHLKNLHKLFFADSTPDKTYRLMYDLLGIDEGPLERIAKEGWSADYVRRETLRGLENVRLAGGTTKIYPGIDVDIPTGPDQKQTEPKDVYDAVTASLKAGAQGVVLSRKYSEMKLANLAAAGDAVRDFRKATLASEERAPAPAL